MNEDRALRLRLVGPASEVEEAWPEVAVLARGTGLDVETPEVVGEGELRVVQARAFWSTSPHRETFFAAVCDLGLDVSLLPDRRRADQGMFFFDADSTLVMGEGIDDLARCAQVESEVAAVTDRAMAGELDYASSLRRRVSLLEGLPVSALEKVARGLVLRPGAKRCVRDLHARGWPVVVLSGGFDFYLEEIQRRIGVDAFVGNRLEIRHGVLTGQVVGEILDAAGKARELRRRQAEAGANFTVAVGDGANDRPMLEAAIAGLGVAPRPALLPAVDGVLSGTSFDRLLPLLGL